MDLRATMMGDVDMLDANQKAYWELKNVFGGIYSTVQLILRTYANDVWKPLSDGLYLTTIDSSLGDPKTDHICNRRKVDLGWFWSLLDENYNVSKNGLVTCEQWQKFVGINNALARIYVTVKEYKRMRHLMSKPDNYISISFYTPIPYVGSANYFEGLKKCFDYKPNELFYYPYFP